MGCWERGAGVPWGVLQWCHGLVWFEFCVSCWAPGQVLHPSALGLSQLVFPSLRCYTGTSDGAPSLFPQHPTFLLLQNPLEQTGEMGANPCPAGFVNNPAPFGVQQTQSA